MIYTADIGQIITTFNLYYTSHYHIITNGFQYSFLRQKINQLLYLDRQSAASMKTGLVWSMFLWRGWAEKVGGRRQNELLGEIMKQYDVMFWPVNLWFMSTDLRFKGSASVFIIS